MLDSASFRRFLFLLLIVPFALPTPAQEKGKPAEESKGSIGLAATRQDGRVLFYLPQSWISKYWKASPMQKAYIALLPPHKDDTEEDSAPCHSPQRIAMGYIDAGNVVHETLVTCVNFCDPRPEGKLFYNGLWGRLTRLDKVDVFPLESGMLDLRLQFKRAGNSQVQTRHLQVKGPRGPLPAGEAGSCSTIE